MSYEHEQSRLRMNAYRYLDPEAASLQRAYPHYSRPVIREETLSELESTEGVGIALGNRGESWIDLGKSQRPLKYARQFEANVMYTPYLDIGKSALIASVLLHPSDLYSFDRLKFPELSVDVSRKHLSIEITDSRITPIVLHDAQTTNGTAVYTGRSPYTGFDYEGWGQDIPQSQSKGGSKEQHEENTDTMRSVTALMKKYQERYLSLGITEFTVCAYAIEHLKSLDGRARERKLHKDFHPDVSQVRKESAGDVYNLLKEELGIR